MKKYLLAITALLFLASCGGGGSDTKSNAALTRMLETQWSEFTSTLPASGGGIALYMSTPKGNYFASTGIENASPDIHFRAASNTKTFTSAAIMLLQQAGKLNIDDLVTANIPGTSEPYIPDASDYAIPYKGEITIKQLLSHRAGVFDVINFVIPATCNAPYAGKYYSDWLAEQEPDHTFTADELVGVVAHCGLSLFKPGTDYHYSNTGYDMLAKIIERVSGVTYAEFLEQNLFIPNELFETSAPYLGTDRVMPDPFAIGYYLNDGKLSSVDNDNMSANVGEGNIASTPANLSRWVKRLATGQAGVSAESVSKMTECITRQSDTVCYGLGLIVSEANPPGIGHNGSHLGFLSLMLYDPQNDVTFVSFASLINYADMPGEQGLFTRVRTEAYRILGY